MPKFKQAFLSTTALFAVMSFLSQAQAANECGAIPAGPNSTVNCAGVFGNGIEYEPVAANSIFTLNLGDGTIGGAGGVTAPNILSFGQIGIAVGDLTAGFLTGAASASAVANINPFSSVFAGAAGVVVFTDGTGNSASINNNGTITATGSGNPYTGAIVGLGALDGEGLMAVSGAAGVPAGSGVAIVVNQAPGIVNALNNGLVAFSTTANATLSNDGAITTQNGDGMTTLLGGLFATGGDAFGINNKAITAGDDGMVIATIGASALATATNSLAGVIKAVDTGIFAFSLSGNAVVLNEGEIEATNGRGISTIDPVFGLLPTGGTVQATNKGKIKAGSDGIFATSLGNATATNATNATIDSVGAGMAVLSAAAATANNSGTVTSTGDNGIFVVGLTGATVNGQNGVVDANQIGVSASATTGPVNIDVGKVTAANDSGVIGTAFNGNVRIDTFGKIKADNGLYGVAGFATNGNSTVTVHAEIDPPAIGASSVTFGAGAAVLNVLPGVSVSGDLIGLTVANTGTGSATINNEGAAFSPAIGAAGLKSGTGGGLTINNKTGGSIIGDLNGVSLISSAPGVATNTAALNNDGLIQGNAILLPVITAVTDGGLTVDNTANGVIQGNLGAAASPLGRFELILLSVGGPTSLSNTGRMTGAIELLSGDGNSVDNKAGGVWNTGGINTMGLGGNDDLINNGFIGTGGITTFLFDGGTDSVTNNAGGLIDVDGIAAFIGTETFDNFGSIAMIDTVATNDLTYIQGDYDGGATGLVSVDAFLDLGGDADELYIDGSATGTTLVQVFDLNPGFASAYDPDGILVVDVDGGVDGQSNFILAGGPIDKGFFDYDLFFVPEETGVPLQNDRWYLRTAPNERAFELAKLASAAKEIWHESASRWLDRTSDLRPFLMGAAAAAVSPGGWVRGFGAFYERDTSNWLDTAPGPVWADTSFDQDIYGVQAGFDFVLHDVFAPEGKLLLGVMGGYTWSKLDFKTTGSRADMDGYSVGAYATYLEGGFFADVLAKAEFHQVDYQTTFSAPDAWGSFDGVSIGAVLDMGYRFGEADGLGPYFLEPGMTIAYVNNEMDPFFMLNTDVDIGNSDSLRGRLGLRAGRSFEAGSQTIIEAFVDASAWHEFVDNTGAKLSSPVDATRVKDVTEGTWGEVGLGLNVTDLGSGMTGFVKGEYRFGEEQDGMSVQAGLRMKF
jgi:outer membrane autotransporter protein